MTPRLAAPGDTVALAPFGRTQGEHVEYSKRRLASGAKLAQLFAPATGATYPWACPAFPGACAERRSALRRQRRAELKSTLLPVRFRSRDLMAGAVLCVSDGDVFFASLRDGDRTPAPRHIAWTQVGHPERVDRSRAELRIAGETYCLSWQDTQILMSYRPADLD